MRLMPRRHGESGGSRSVGNARSPRRSPPIWTARVTPETVFIGNAHYDIPGIQPDVSYRAVECNLDRSVSVARTDAFLGKIRAVVEVLGMPLVGFPNRHVTRPHCGERLRREIGP